MGKKIRVSSDVCEYHPTTDSTSRFSIDRLLRESGYEIFRRRAGQEALWKDRKTREVLSQSEILCYIDERKLADAMMEQEIYEDFTFGD